MSLPPMIDMIGDIAIEHGERGHDLDPVNPYACLCGVEDYLACDGPGIEGLTITAEDDGSISVSREEPP